MLITLKTYDGSCCENYADLLKDRQKGKMLFFPKSTNIEILGYFEVMIGKYHLFINYGIDYGVSRNFLTEYCQNLTRV